MKNYFVPDEDEYCEIRGGFGWKAYTFFVLIIILSGFCLMGG